MKKELKSRIRTLLLALAVLMALSLLWGFFVEPNMLTVTQVGFTDHRLPNDMDGIRIVYVADIHVGPFYSPADVERVTVKIAAMKPDMLLFGGDMLQHPASAEKVDSTRVSAAFAAIKPRLGKYAILGNHDIWSPEMQQIAEKILADGGFTLLYNSAAKVEPGFYIAGTAPWPMQGENNPNNHSDVSKIAWTTDNGAFSLLLAHEPAQIRKDAQYPFAFQLSGHTHGGQVAIPFTGTMFKLGNLEVFESGIFKLNDTTMYVTRGIGTSVVRLRLFVPPEIVVLTLHSK